MNLDLSQDFESIKRLLPEGWEAQARQTGAFHRSRYTKTPGEVLRLLLTHASHHQALRTTARMVQAAGLSSLSHVALFKRLRHSKDWLSWIAKQLLSHFSPPALFWKDPYRFRVVDSTMIQRPKSTEKDLRLHYSLNLATLCCDGFALTDAQEAESLTRIQIKEGDVLLGDRAFDNEKQMKQVVKQGGHVLVRCKWKHAPLFDAEGQRVSVLSLGRTLPFGASLEQEVMLGAKAPIVVRVVVQKLPKVIAKNNQARLQKRAQGKGKPLDPRSVEAASLVVLLTTLPSSVSKDEILSLYRFRWQIELSFKRLKQLLHLGYPPHKDETVLQAYILSKLVLAFLIEILLQNRLSFSPWGF